MTIVIYFLMTLTFLLIVVVSLISVIDNTDFKEDNEKD